jgi:predicted kinase
MTIPNGAPTLLVFGGLPATGKTTLSKALAKALGAVHLRVDTIEQTLRDAGIALRGPEGYLVAYAIARENLRLGHSVISDSVNGITITRETWRSVACACGARLFEIEVICSDAAEHRRRVESRGTDIDGLRLPTWQQVVEREYEPWPGALTVDTAGTDEQGAFARLRERLGLR